MFFENFFGLNRKPEKADETFSFNVELIGETPTSQDETNSSLLFNSVAITHILSEIEKQYPTEVPHRHAICMADEQLVLFIYLKDSGKWQGVTFTESDNNKPVDQVLADIIKCVEELKTVPPIEADEDAGC